MKKVIVVAGARPNFMKVSPLLKAFRKHRGVRTLLVHTGQHYDFKMSSVFFKELEIPAPDIYLKVGPGTHAVQTSKVLEAFERVLLKEKPDLTIVVGDVNSTLACALAASKLHVPVAHVEAGLRSFDRHMPEEINRIVTDRLSDFLFVTEKSGMENLKREGIEKQKIFFTGNVMIDTLLSSCCAIDASKVLQRFALRKNDYAVVTLHRPSNVDSKMVLRKVADILQDVSTHTKLIFPIHPRTLTNIHRFGLANRFKGIKKLMLIEPLGHVDFIRLVRDGLFVLTDSGGMQEEATVLQVPCLTMRENTERPSTVKEGTNQLVGLDKLKILNAVKRIGKRRWKKALRPRFWDGKAAQRIAQIIVNIK